ncbi:MAG: DUF262 domain-containing HNH endonuclease family protein [Bacteroidales bacterium]
MQFRQENILTFFDSTQRYFIIPVYQRAYSWEKREWQTFLDDLKEQIEGDNNYFFGNILLEQIKEGIEYEIIDGQQRLLTLTIFMRALINVFEKRKESGEKIDVDIESKKSIYLKHNGNIKLRPVDYDRACFEDLIINNRDFETNSISQKRMKEAKIFFTEELNNEKTETLLNILDKLEKTNLITIELVGKKDSALMFELQNNRGKDLTNMEKLKSYFIYQMYVYSPKDETETNIEYVSNIFKQIYLIINDLKELEEDSILIYHSYAYIKGYYYRTISDIKDTFKNSTKDKVEWIKDFVNELHTTFTNFKQLENSNLTYYQDLKRLKIPAFVYPFIVKGYKFFGDSSEKLNSLFNILEVLVFRYQLINSRADILSRLNEILLNFNGDLKKLKIDLQNKLNETWYWSDERISEYLNSGMYENRVLHYLLWKYEDYIQSEGYNIKNISLENEQIEHISPQTPTDGKLASGYQINENGDYDDKFKNEYLNCLGNLMLISGSHNSSIGNKPFKEKLKSYINNPLLKQQAEIKDFISGNLENPLWDKTAIDKRHKKIVDFAEKKWSFDNLII